MIKYLTFDLSQRDLPDSVFREVQNRIPFTSESNDVFLTTVRLDESSSHAQWLLKTLKENNLHAAGHEIGNGESYGLTIEIEYTSKEIDQSDYLSIWPSSHVRFFRSHESTDCHEIAFWATDKKKFQNNHLIGANASRVMLAHPSIVEAIKTKHLIGPDIFIPTLYPSEKSKKEITWDSIGLQRFCIASQIELPQMHPDVIYLNTRNERWTPESPRGIGLSKDGRFMQQTIHYLKSDLDRVGPFDIAYTAETFGIQPSIHPRKIIVSKQLYDILKQYDDDLSPEPVFIHDE